MSGKEIFEMIESLDNGQKQILKNMMYEKYFRVASDEQLRKDAHILQMYYDGELVESNHDDY